MTLTPREQLIGVGALVLLLGGGYFAWRREVQHQAVVQFMVKAQDSTAKVQQKAVDSASSIAQEAEKQAEVAKSRALAQIEAGKRLQAHTDSVAREASNERTAARKLLADSVSTISQLRAGLAALDSASRADSVANADQHHVDQRTIAALLATVSADSLALTAERQRSASLQALTATLQKEVGLLKAQMPSSTGKALRLVGEVVGAGAAVWFGTKLK